MSERFLDWDWAGRPCCGEAVSGDGVLVAVNHGRAVATVVDGLGHGSAAAIAAQRALEAVRESGDEDVVVLIERCHVALRETRGAVMSVAAIDRARGSMSWIGVGNVEGRIVRAPHGHDTHAAALVLSPGVVGHELSSLRATTVGLKRGDLLVMATDGVDRRYADGLRPSGSCTAIAQALLERHARHDDDALVAVLRYLGDEA